VTRTRILDAAAHVFYNKGYALTRLSDIAKRARTQTGSIYYYFESREAIVAEVLRIANERTAQHVLGAIAELPPGADKIVAAVHGHFSIVLSGDPYTAAHMRIFDQIPVRLRDYFLRVLDERAAVWRKLFADAESAGEIRDGLDLSVVRLLVLGMINWSIEWYKPGGLSPDEIAETAAAILFDGIAKKKAKR
jgi:AcrR family transcriptional regulator